MAFFKTNPSPHYYTLLLPQQKKNYVVLALCHPAKDSQRRRVIFIVILILFLVLAYTLWPSDPKIKIVRLHLNKIRIQFQSFPIVRVEISLQITVNVRNVDAYSLNYTRISVGVKYRGKKLGHVKSKRGHVAAYASSDVDVELKFSGLRVFPDVVALIEDLARGRVPFETVTEVTGTHDFLFFEFPSQAKASCEVLINTNNQTIVHQNCYIER